VTWRKTNATASFSWFLYQADIALWKTLKKIQEIWDNQEELERWSLEVEGEEDFTFYRIDWKNKERESYQVKETNKTNVSGYTEAVIKLFQEQEQEQNKEWKRKSFLVTEKKVEFDKNITFLDWLYSWNWLTEDKWKLKYLKNWINKEWTFLSGKIFYCNKDEKHKFNENETKESIEKFTEKETKDFFDNNFKYIFWDNKNEVHKKINDLLEKLNPKIHSEYHFRYLESKIKRFIQEKKKNETFPNIQFSKVCEIIDKPSNVIIDEVIKSEYYQEIFINHFKDLFTNCIDEVFEDEFILKDIKGDVFVDYLGFKDDFKKDISRNILENDKKMLLFINDTSLKEWINYLNNKDKKKENFRQLLKNTSTFIQKTNLKNKIGLLIRLYYFKIKWLSITSDWYFWNELNNKTWFKIWDKKGILTWNQSLYWNSSKSDIKSIIEKNFYYLYEQHFIWIRDSFWNIDWFLDIKENIEKNKVGYDEEKKQKYDVTKIKSINIFCCDCRIEHKDKILSRECWKNNCKYKNKN